MRTIPIAAAALLVALAHAASAGVSTTADQLGPLAQATAPGVPLMTPWNRAFTASGRIVDTRL